MHHGKVYLVGAGPGDAGLLTLRGKECLQRADLILYDYLVSARVLRFAREDAEQTCLGRHGHSRIWTQQEINERMVAAAREGKIVVRLKGGDPGLFARAVEELEALAAADIAFEIVPGVTAALAASSYAGIPLTQRQRSSAVALVTGHEEAGKAPPALDYRALAQFPGTLVVYMGVTTADQWTAALIQAGKPADTPAAIVRRCSLPDQCKITCRLEDVPKRIRALRPPAVVIIGEVASWDDSFAWFEQRPLFGQRVMVTRPAGQADELARPLEEAGAEVLLQPAIRIGDPPDRAPLDDALGRLSDFDWLVFASSNGVRYFLNRLRTRGFDFRVLAHLRLAAIGPGTAAELARFHLDADLVPAEFRAEALADALRPLADGQRFLLVRASRGRQVLAQQLQAAGGHVEQVVAYESRDVEQPETEIAEQLAAGHIDWTIVTSSAIARSLSAMFGARLEQTRLVSLSPVTSQTLRELGWAPAVEARDYTMPGVVEALLQHVSATPASS